MLSAKQQLLLNAVLFQAQWFICVTANNQIALLSFVFVLLLHWYFLKPHTAEISLIIIFTILGIVVESAAATMGFVEFTHQKNIPIGSAEFAVAPIWLIIMWANFSTTLCHCLQWLQNKLWLSSLLAMVFIPINYIVGSDISGSTFPVSSSLFIAYETTLWMVLLPMGLHLAKRSKAKTRKWQSKVLEN